MSPQKRKNTCGGKEFPFRKRIQWIYGLFLAQPDSDIRHSPQRIVAHDMDDAYFVLACLLADDKGSATCRYVRIEYPRTVGVLPMPQRVGQREVKGIRLENERVFSILHHHQPDVFVGINRQIAHAYL